MNVSLEYIVSQVGIKVLCDLQPQREKRYNDGEDGPNLFIGSHGRAKLTL